MIYRDRAAFREQAVDDLLAKLRFLLVETVGVIVPGFVAARIGVPTWIIWGYGLLGTVFLLAIWVLARYENEIAWYERRRRAAASESDAAPPPGRRPRPHWHSGAIAPPVEIVYVPWLPRQVNSLAGWMGGAPRSHA